MIAGQQVAQNQPSLELLRHDFDTLLHDFHQEYVSLNLDEIIVGAIGQVVSLALFSRADSPRLDAICFLGVETF